MRVLVVHPGSKFFGGAEIVIKNLHEYLNSHGHTCGVLLKEPTPGLDGMCEEPARTWKRLRDVVQQVQGVFDVINVHNFPATFAAMPSKTPVIWSCNEPPELFTNLWRKPIESLHRRMVSKHVKHAIVADKSNADRFYKLYGFYPDIIPYGIDTEFFSPSGKKVPWVLGKPVVLQVGTVTPYKNQMMSVKVIEQLRRMGWVGIRLYLVGSPTDRGYAEDIRKYIKRHLLEDTVFLCGQASREHTRDLYFSSDIIIHPIKPQGGWLAPFEAIVARKPVLVSEEFTGVSLLEEHNLGYVCRSFEDYVRWIEVLIEGRPNGKVLDTRKQWVMENLTWDRYCRAVLKKFEEVIC